VPISLIRMKRRPEGMQKERAAESQAGKTVTESVTASQKPVRCLGGILLNAPGLSPPAGDKIQLIQRDERIQSHAHRTARKPRGLRHRAGMPARRTLNALPVSSATAPVTELAVKQNPLPAEVARMHLPRILPASSAAKSRTHARSAGFQGTPGIMVRL
jgi:hypothetical protein